MLFRSPDTCKQTHTSTLSTLAVLQCTLGNGKLMLSTSRTKLPDGLCTDATVLDCSIVPTVPPLFSHPLPLLLSPHVKCTQLWSLGNEPAR